MEFSESCIGSAIPDTDLLPHAQKSADGRGCMHMEVPGTSHMKCKQCIRRSTPLVDVERGGDGIWKWAAVDVEAWHVENCGFLKTRPSKQFELRGVCELPNLR